jgi:hypothetical protein
LDRFPIPPKRIGFVVLVVKHSDCRLRTGVINHV